MGDGEMGDGEMGDGRIIPSIVASLYLADKILNNIDDFNLYLRHLHHLLLNLPR